MHDFTPFYSPFTLGFMSIFAPLILVVVLWTIVLKGYALWYAARASQKWWFIVLLVVNTLGILEIVYLIWFRPKSNTSVHDVRNDAPVHTSSPAQ
jgi:methionyl-tRNA synthetase